MMLTQKVVLPVCVSFLVVVAGPPNAVRAGAAEQRFYEAYYREQEDHDWAGAAQLYQEVLGDHRAPNDLRARAAVRLAGCREELVSSDFARLMPPNAMVYVEIDRPGDQLVKLLDKLGLLAKAERFVAQGGKRVAVSPTLVREVLGIRGAAVAVTGFNPIKQAPMGVLVFHPGELAVIRGALETGLPIGGTAEKPIGGFPTFSVEGEALVTLTSRLVIVSTERNQIQAVVDRLQGRLKDSLATNAAMVKAMGERQGALLHFFINAKAMMPYLKGMMALGATQSREVAMAQALLDIDSLQSLTGRVGISDDGLFLEFGLRLDEGHHNLVYNFFRTPAINPETLQCVPKGVAAVIAGAINESTSRFSPGSQGTAPVVTLLDFGREIFANITSFALFVLPPGASAADRPEGGPPIPDAAAVFTVNDPAKSQALWTTVLGVASLASRGAPIEGASVKLEGVEVRSFALPNTVNILVATVGHDVLIASSKTAMAASIQARQDGRSIRNDEAFTTALSKLGPSATKALLVHAGRVARIARRFIPPDEAKEIEPFLDVLRDTVASCVVEHSGEQFRVSAALTGIPDVGDLVARQVTQEARRHEANQRIAGARRQHQWNEALKVIDAELGQRPGNVRLWKTKFDILAVDRKAPDAALACADAFYDKIKDDAAALNNFAWALLTQDRYGNGFDEAALKFSQRSNELTDYRNWMFLDTLALAEFKTGDVERAVALEKKAIEHCHGRGLKALKKALARFEAGAGHAELTGGPTSD